MGGRIARMYRIRVHITFANGASWSKWVGPIRADDHRTASIEALRTTAHVFPRAEIETTGGWRRDRREESRIAALEESQSC